MITVYHGSTFWVDTPLVGVGRDDLDFGKGFYVTDLKEQAVRWARRLSANRRIEAVLNIYGFDIDKAKAEYKYHQFSHYDKQWLRFIAGNRRGQELWREYDLIEGGVANDRIATTLELFMNNYISEDEALGRLSTQIPNNQICITNQSIIESCLFFKDAIKL